MQSFIFAYASRVVHNIHAYDESITTEGPAISLQHFHPSPFRHPITSSVLSLFSHPKRIPGTDPRTCEVIYNENRPEKAAFVMSWQHYKHYNTTNETTYLNHRCQHGEYHTTFIKIGDDFTKAGHMPILCWAHGSCVNIAPIHMYVNIHNSQD